MNFIGTWQCRDGRTAEVTESDYELGGPFRYFGKVTMNDGHQQECSWDDNGDAAVRDLDLVLRLSGWDRRK